MVDLVARGDAIWAQIEMQKEVFARASKSKDFVTLEGNLIGNHFEESSEANTDA